MRGVAVFLTGLLTLAAVTMFAGVLLEPILATVATNPAVESLGWASTSESITDTVLRWMPLLFIAYLLVWAGAWYFRRERRTGVNRRP